MMIKLVFKKTILLGLVTALALASLPILRVSAAGSNDPDKPPAGGLTNERLEKI